jgi:hypothetical protein
MSCREINAYARREVREAKLKGMPLRVVDAMNTQIDQENRRYRFALDRASGLVAGRREAVTNAQRRLCAAVFAVADVARSFSMGEAGDG